MNGEVEIIVDGRCCRVAADLTVAAALLNLGVTSFRNTVTSAPRAPLCAMGTCFECRVVVNGVAGTRACLEPVHAGMTIGTAS